MVAIKALGVLSALLATDLASQASARPTQEVPAVRRSAPKGGNLSMIPSNKFRAPSNGKTPALERYALHDVEQLFFGETADHPIAAMAARPVDKDAKFLSNAQISDDVKVICDGDSVDLTFPSLSNLQAAQKDWEWVAQAEAHNVVFIGDDNCSPNNVALYKIDTIKYDEAALTAQMNGRPVVWTDVVGQVALHFDTRGIDASAAFEPSLQAKLKARGEDDSLLHAVMLPRQDPLISKTGDIPWSYNQNGVKLLTVPLANDTEFSIGCEDCTGSGNLHYELSIETAPMLPLVGKAKVELRDAQLRMGLSLGLTGTVEVSESITLPLFAMTPTSIPGLFSFGPQLILGIGAGASLEASLTVSPIGGVLTFPENPSMELTLPGAGIASGFTPSFEAFTPVVKGQITGSADIAPFVAVGLDITVFPGVPLAEVGCSAGLIAEVPKVEVSFTAEASTGGGACGNPSAVGGISVNANIGGELSLFAGLEPITNARDIKVASLFKLEHPIFEQCFAFGNLIEVEWAHDLDFTGKHQKFTTQLDSSCTEVAPDFQDQITSIAVGTTSTTSNGCHFYSDAQCTTNVFTVTQGLRNTNLDGTMANDIIKAFKCCEDIDNC